VGLNFNLKLKQDEKQLVHISIYCYLSRIAVRFQANNGYHHRSNCGDAASAEVHVVINGILKNLKELGEMEQKKSWEFSL
jgi:glucosamine 6-phosphate synthetase-like amidotransferase/phosphosugar isomerase protein